MSKLNKDVEKYRQEEIEGYDECDDEYSEYYQLPLYSQAIPGTKYEYLDHTADVQIHAWGDSLHEAFEWAAQGMFGYMTNLKNVDMLEEHTIEAEGDDMMSLLYHFLDEFLFLFCAEPFIVAKRVKITEFDKENFKIKATGWGEPFDISKHHQGTEVKAITYSNMQIYDEEGKHEVFVIIDI